MRLPLGLLERITGRKLSVDQVAGYLGKVGFPVEGVIQLLPRDKGLITARVTGVVSEDEKGVVLSTDAGGKRLQAYSHQPVPADSVVGLALSGSSIGKKLLGEHPGVDAAVLCEKDLGLEDDSPLILEDDVPSGKELAEVLGSEVLDVEITPNRGDLYGVYGLVRELSPLLGEKFLPPRLEEPRIGSGSSFDLDIKAEEDVHLYYGFLIDELKVEPSPFWLRWLIHSFGARPVNNVVDATNYVMFLTGQPLHPFDAANIRGRAVQVRRARKKEMFEAIDHREYKLGPEVPMIADKDRSLAMAGVMGGVDSEVTEATRSLFLESAEFSQVAVRRTISETGLTTDSAKRFAAGVDPELVRYGALALISTLARICPGIKVMEEHHYGGIRDKGSIELKLAKLASYAGTTIEPKQAERNLEFIGFDVQLGEESISAAVPSHRSDMTEDVDLIEEILRMSGYDKLPSRFEIRSSQIACNHPFSHRLGLVRDFLAGQGLDEIYCLSLISAEDAADYPEERLIPITNPLSERMSVLRPSLMPGMLKSAAGNLRYDNTDLRLYEIGKVYSGQNGSYTEDSYLGILISGRRKPVRWDQDPCDVDFFDLKGLVETFIRRFDIRGVEFQPEEAEGFSSEVVSLKLSDSSIGVLGRISRPVLDRFQIPQDVYLFEADVGELLKASEKQKFFESLPRFKPVQRDLAMLLDKHHQAALIVEFIRRAAGDTCTDVEVFDSFTGDPLPHGRRNLALRLTFQPRKRNLGKQELDSLMEELSAKVKQRFNAVVRGREDE